MKRVVFAFALLVAAFAAAAADPLLSLPLFGGYVRTDAATGDRSEGGFVVIEPEVCAFVAVTPSSRIGIGASYRLGIPVEGTAATLADLSGPSAFLALRYGAIRPTPPGERRRLSLAGGISQKFAIVKGQIARYDGGYTVWSSTTGGRSARWGTACPTASISAATGSRPWRAGCGLSASSTSEAPSRSRSAVWRVS